MSTNHKPTIRGTDKGIWRRTKLLPFSVSIPDDQVDRDLPAKLRAEAPGILAWAVRGYVDWRTRGLDPPAAVTTATAEYRAEMDVLADFLAECTVVDPFAYTDNAEVFRRFTSWCEENGERPRAHRWLSRQLKERGFEQDNRRDAGRRWRGIKVIGEPAQRRFNGREWPD